MMEEQLAAGVRAANGPEYPETRDPRKLADKAGVLAQLRQVDWAFAEDDTSFLTHNLHPYPAKFIPQIPGHLIACLSLRGELVLDPFGGSGTAALEAVRLGRRAISIDANPLASLIGRVKSCRLTRAAMTDLNAVESTIRCALSDSAFDSLRLLAEFEEHVPIIPNREKWFADGVCGELAFIRYCISQVASPVARDIAQLALSKTILKASFQDSETRYASKPRRVPPGEALGFFLSHVRTITASVVSAEPAVRYGTAEFVTADARQLGRAPLPEASVDLITTSPPYANAYDYHLYHRFRLLWLGHDPTSLADIEIGSHLRHQREGSGFSAYLSDIGECLAGMLRVLRPGRYAALVVGDAIFDGELHEGGAGVVATALQVGFESVGRIERTIHDKKRSVVRPGQRATTEEIVLVRKPARKLKLMLMLPPYQLWDYEETLRRREAETLLGAEIGDFGWTTRKLGPLEAPLARRLTFTHRIGFSEGQEERTWQAVLENGFDADPSSRKEAHYVTHGIHPYKGKFYPQLAKALMNLVGAAPATTVLDPFCGSGTCLLEAYLSGRRGIGFDLNPLAAMIARAKVGALCVEPSVFEGAVHCLFAKLEDAPASPSLASDLFPPQVIDEMISWFPPPVVAKLGWVLQAIRSVSTGTLRAFFEVILSSIVRDVSQQEPRDLRIRRRETPLDDADVFARFHEAVSVQWDRVRHFWSIRGYAPHDFIPASAYEGDSRKPETFAAAGILEGSVDLVVTSPPYATALPYIDTDRLSLLVLMGITASDRRPLERELTGSREILKRERSELEGLLLARATSLPDEVESYIGGLLRRISDRDHGFRRQNLPALLVRFFRDIRLVMENCWRVLRPGAEAVLVLGDNRTTVDTEPEAIPTTTLVEELCMAAGFELAERIPITVTKENLLHSRNSITENVVLRLRRPA